MEISSSSGNIAGIQMNVMLAGHSMIDFDKRQIRKALVKNGGEVRKEARRLISRRAVSSPDDFPGESSGATKRSIKIYKRGSRGGYVKLGPTKTSEMNVFYPAFLFYGSVKIHLGRRANYMVAALDNKREVVRGNMRAAMSVSLIPRKA